MLAGTVDPLKRFFIQQAGQSVFFSCFSQDIHHQLVLVDCNIAFRIYRSDLKLSGCYFVVLCFGIDAEFPEFFVNIFHKSGNSHGDRSEIVVIKFLCFWRRCAEQCPACQLQVSACFKCGTVDQEVFLFQTDRRIAGTHILIPEQVDDTGRRMTHSLDRFQKRIFLVQRFAVI